MAYKQLEVLHGFTRIGSLAGVGFAIFFFVGVAMLEIPENATDQELVAWWSDSGNRTAAVVSMYLFVLAGLCFLIFLVALRSRLLAVEGGSGDLTALAVGSGLVFVSLLSVAAAARGVIGFAVESPANNEPLPGPDTLRYLPQIGYAITGTGGLLAAAAFDGSDLCADSQNGGLRTLARLGRRRRRTSRRRCRDRALGCPSHPGTPHLDRRGQHFNVASDKHRPPGPTVTRSTS